MQHFFFLTLCFTYEIAKNVKMDFFIQISYNFSKKTPSKNGMAREMWG